MAAQPPRTPAQATSSSSSSAPPSSNKKDKEAKFARYSNKSLNATELAKDEDLAEEWRTLLLQDNYAEALQSMCKYQSKATPDDSVIRFKRLAAIYRLLPKLAHSEQKEVHDSIRAIIDGFDWLGKRGDSWGLDWEATGALETVWDTSFTEYYSICSAEDHPHLHHFLGAARNSIGEIFDRWDTALTLSSKLSAATQPGRKRWLPAEDENYAAQLKQHTVDVEQEVYERSLQLGRPCSLSDLALERLDALSDCWSLASTFPQVAGVYLLYYNGKEPLYAGNVRPSTKPRDPIYVGKSRTNIHTRLGEHWRSISNVGSSLRTHMFAVRFLVVTDWTYAECIESKLIAALRPAWNSEVLSFSFGNAKDSSNVWNRYHCQKDQETIDSVHALFATVTGRSSLPASSAAAGAQPAPITD
jgi:hypothetical protein